MSWTNDGSEITRRAMNLGKGLTVGQVEDLRQEAACVGDEAMVAICDGALALDEASLVRVRFAITWRYDH
jgi:hypothetical protein